MKKEISLTIIDRRKAKENQVINVITDELEVYKSFADQMKAKYIDKVPSIKRVVSETNYDETITVRFYFTNDIIYKFIVNR